MWIAKPVRDLSESERKAWLSIPEKPLSQTFAWGEAGRALGAIPFLIMNADERVGGIVLLDPSHPGEFECVNGPLIHWSDPGNAPRQIATFAMAASKLGKDFKRLTLRPRWKTDEICQLLEGLPIEASRIDEASTWVTPIEETDELQISKMRPRLRRTLRSTLSEGVDVRVGEATQENLAEFVEFEIDFARKKNFFAPPLSWFETLAANTSELKLFLITTELRREPGHRARLLIGVSGTSGYYLFGHDTRGKSPLSSRLSLASVAHVEALKLCRRLSVSNYDMNGFTPTDEADHPYARVAAFKAQFSGAPIHYSCPEFVIEA